MITIKKLGLRRLKNPWQMLEHNPRISPYQYFQFSQILNSHYLLYSLRSRELPSFFAAYEDTRCIAIFPLCKQGKDVYATFGAGASLQLNDALYGEDMTAEKLRDCVVALVESLGEIRFGFVPESSLLCAVLRSFPHARTDRIMDNVSISAGRSFEEYFASLSKSVRQNVRTSYNRLQADERSLSSELYAGRTVPHALRRELMTVYLARRNSQYQSVSRAVAWLLRHYHYQTVGLTKLPNSMHFILRIDGQIAAFWEGYLDHQGTRLIIPRLAINDAFRRYSPGSLLICESMKRLNVDHGITDFDLSAGGEQYKYSMGGTSYLSYSITVDRKDLQREQA